MGKYQKVFFFAPPYAVSCSVLYLLGYWTTFKLNIFEFISLSDIVKLSIYPLILSLSAVMFGAAVETARQAKQADSTKSSKKHWRCTLIIAYVVLFSISVVQYIEGSPYWWLTMTIIAVPIAFYFLPLHPDLLKDYISNPSLRLAVLWLLFFIPLASFVSGKIDSAHILSGTRVRYVDVSTFKNDKLFRGEQKLKYVGLKGNHLFFLSLDNQRIFITTFAEVPVLGLERNPKPQPDDQDEEDQE